MAKQVVEQFEIDGVTVEIGPAISKDAGLVVVTRHIRNAAWFSPMVDRLLAALPSSPHSAFGFGARAKLEAGLMTLIAGLVMGRRNPNAMAQSFALGPLWTGMVGRPFIQRELSRLMELLSDYGNGSLRRALLESAQEGQDSLELDMDNSLLELQETQEKGSYNGHDHAFGNHAGWALNI